jgi:hypothetical protein
MAIFLDLHRDAIGGTIATFDRLIFKGHLNALFPPGAFKRYRFCQISGQLAESAPSG